MDYENNVYEKTCAGCGKQFFCSNIRTKYCSPKCRDHNYYANVRKKRGNLGEEGRKAKLDEYIASQIPQGFKYVSGYTGSDSTIVLRCDKCGGEFECSFATIRHQHRINCKNCSKKKREEQAALKDEERKQREKQREEKAKDFYITHNIAIRSGKEPTTCKWCGKEFYIEQHMGATIKYCCDTCRRNAIRESLARNRKSGAQQRKKRVKTFKQNGVYDNDITLERLYERDGGVCAICGGKTDFKDYVIDESGYFIVGNAYPSIDHIKPCAKGGTHTWDNVQLAHFICNSIKGDKFDDVGVPEIVLTL